MPLHIIKQDITKMPVDAIVNSTNSHLVGYSGVDRIIHELGGEALERECAELRDTCYLGEAVYTHAYNLPCKYIIHTVCPLWQGGMLGDEAILRGCYRQSLEVAESLGVHSVAVPLISAGSMGFPIAGALSIATTTISEYLALYDEGLEVWLVLFGEVVTRIAETMYGDLDKYVSENAAAKAKVTDSLGEISDKPRESFVSMMNRFMNEKGFDKPVQVYKPIGISRSTHSKIICGGTKSPNRDTCLRYAIGLHLTYDETVEFLASAGRAFPDGSKFDLIISYFLKEQNYDLYEIDVQLLRYGYDAMFGLE